MSAPDGLVVAARRRESARARRITTVLLALLLAMTVLSLSYGDFQISLPDIVRSLLGLPTPPGVDYIMHSLRLPRTVTGTLVGLAFGLAGAIFQQLLRNPLASPDIIGVSQGASAAALGATVLFGVGGFAIPVLALVGSLLTAGLIYLLSWRQGVTGYRFVLVGIGVGTALLSLTSFLLTRADVRVASDALVWLSGSINGRTWQQVIPIAIAVLILVPIALTLGRSIIALQLGDDLARGFGLRVEASRFVLLLAAVCLAGLGTAAAGPVAFVAFLSGPIAARLVGGGRPVLFPAGLVGALVVLLADFIGAHLLGPTQFPVGVITGVIGAPYLLWLLATANRSGRGG